MDTLTFAAPVLYRRLTFSEAKKAPISEISLEKALEGLDMTMSHVSGAPTYPNCADRARTVYRPVHITWLRLPRSHQGRRSQERIETDKRVRWVGGSG